MSLPSRYTSHAALLSAVNSAWNTALLSTVNSARSTTLFSAVNSVGHIKEMWIIHEDLITFWLVVNVGPNNLAVCPERGTNQMHIQFPAQQCVQLNRKHSCRQFQPGNRDLFQQSQTRLGRDQGHVNLRGWADQTYVRTCSKSDLAAVAEMM